MFRGEMMEEEGRWITTKAGNRVFIKTTNAYMNDKIRSEYDRKKNKNKKVDYDKYKEIRSTSVDAFIAPNGNLDYLSEEQAKELVELGVDEKLLPYGYVFKEDSDIKDRVKEIGKSEFVKRYEESAKRTKQQDDEYQIERKKTLEYNEKRKKVEKYIDDLKYDGTGSKNYKDYESENVSYKIDQETLKTITNDWGFKDETRDYFNKLDEETTRSIEDYTSQTEHYNYAYLNNILNENWKGYKLDDEATKRVKLIDKAIENSAIDENMYVYRAGDIAFINSEGEIISKGYTSTSLYNDVESFTDSPDIFRIRIPAGTKGLYIGSNTMSWIQEYEVLLGRNTKLKVLGKNIDGTIECILVEKKKD